MTREQIFMLLIFINTLMCFKNFKIFIKTPLKMNENLHIPLLKIENLKYVMFQLRFNLL